MVRRGKPVKVGLFRCPLVACGGNPVGSLLVLALGWVLRRRLCVRPDDVLQFLATSDEFLDDWLLWRASSDSLKVFSIGQGSSTSRRLM